jgi:hypothetical protein
MTTVMMMVLEKVAHYAIKEQNGRGSRAPQLDVHM